MKRHYVLFTFVILLYSIFSSRYADCANISAKTCLQADVAAAISSASDGDTVSVPEGSCSWDNLEVAKGILLKGAGMDSTKIISSGSSQILRLEVGHNIPVRVTGFRFDGNNGATYGVRLDTNTAQKNNLNLRIDHNKFQNCSRDILTYGRVEGVIDHNEFYDTYTSSITIYGDGDTSWTRGGDIGSLNALYVEDNIFVYNAAVPQRASHAVTSNYGARYVARNNIITTDGINDPASVFDAHGYCSVPYSGTYLFEIYDNTINVGTGGSIFQGFEIRGGRGAIFNNKINGTVNTSTGAVIFFTNYRSCTFRWSSAACQPTGYTECHSEAGSGPTKNEGYPCKGQINNMYVWNNLYNGQLVSPLVETCDEVKNDIKENRDFFTYKKDGYLPYKYPHPLTNTIPSPNNLRVAE